MTDHAIPPHLTVATAYVGVLLEYLAAHGIDAAAFAAKAGIDRNDPTAQIEARAYVRMLDEAAELTKDPDIGLHLGERVQARHLGVQGYAVMSAATLAESLDRALQYQTLVDTINRAVLETRGAESALVWEPTPYSPGRAFSELDVTSWVVFSRLVTGLPLQFARIDFRHPQPVDTREHQRILRCPLRFGAEREAIAFPTAVLKLPMPQPDPMMQKIMDELGQRLLIQAAATDDPVECARAYVSRQLTHTLPKVEEVAGQVGLATRTLQRKLTENGMTYSALVDGVRRELAERYLADPGIQMAEVAFLLGYSEQSAFQRAFKRWTGDSPGSFRQRALTKH